MRKRELNVGIIAGVLWAFWIIITLNPQILRFFAANMNMIKTPVGLEMIGPRAAIVILILGLLINQKTIVGAGCLAMIGLDLWRLLGTNSLAMLFRGSRGLLPISHLSEALSFLLLLLLLAVQEKPVGKVLAASVLALIAQISSVTVSNYSRALGNSELIVAGIILYVTAVSATGMYFAGLKPEVMNESFGKSRGAGSSGKGYMSSTNSLRKGASGEDIRQIRGAESEEKKRRINNLKALRDNGLMTKEEYNEMVEKIKRS